MISHPCRANFATVPPAPNSASSGCAVTTMTRSILSAMNTLLLKIGRAPRPRQTVPGATVRSSSLSGSVAIRGGTTTPGCS